MDRDRLLSGLQIASNLGLLVGLALVGLQIKQASDLTRNTLLVTSFQHELDHNDAMMGENAAAVVARAQTEPESLTAADIPVLQAWAEWQFTMMRRNAHLEALGMFPSSGWRQFVPLIGANLASNPVTREYLMGYLVEDPEVARAIGYDWVNVMQDEARRTPPDAGKRFIEHMLRTARASGQSAGVDAATAAQEQ